MIREKRTVFGAAFDYRGPSPSPPSSSPLLSSPSCPSHSELFPLRALHLCQNLPVKLLRLETVIRSRDFGTWSGAGLTGDGPVQEVRARSPCPSVCRSFVRSLPLLLLLHPPPPLLEFVTPLAVGREVRMGEEASQRKVVKLENVAQRSCPPLRRHRRL